MAVSNAAHECLFLRKVVTAMFEKDITTTPPTIIYEDNEACRKWCENPINHAKQKHIDVAFHFVREQQTEFKNLKVCWIDGTENPADLGTKPLAAPAFEKHYRFMMNLGDHSLLPKTKICLTDAHGTACGNSKTDSPEAATLETQAA